MLFTILQYLLLLNLQRTYNMFNWQAIRRLPLNASERRWNGIVTVLLLIVTPGESVLLEAPINLILFVKTTRKHVWEGVSPSSHHSICFPNNGCMNTFFHGKLEYAVKITHYVTGAQQWKLTADSIVSYTNYSELAPVTASVTVVHSICKFTAVSSDFSFSEKIEIMFLTLSLGCFIP